jgi:hypothetical protein
MMWAMIANPMTLMQRVYDFYQCIANKVAPPDDLGYPPLNLLNDDELLDLSPLRTGFTHVEDYVSRLAETLQYERQEKVRLQHEIERLKHFQQVVMAYNHEMGAARNQFGPQPLGPQPLGPQPFVSGPPFQQRVQVAATHEAACRRDQEVALPKDAADSEARARALEETEEWEKAEREAEEWEKAEREAEREDKERMEQEEEE